VGSVEVPYTVFPMLTTEAFGDKQLDGLSEQLLS
jgi:hypothetical protein